MLLLNIDMIDQRILGFHSCQLRKSFFISIQLFPVMVGKPDITLIGLPVDDMRLAILHID